MMGRCALLLLLLVAVSTGFLPVQRACRSTRIFEETNGSESKSLSPTEQILERERTSDDPAPADSSDRYPLNIPSPILLASSILLAIVSTGSLFQFAGDSTNLTAGSIGAVGVPTCLFLFYAAITKAIVETEEDDEAYLKGK